VRIKNYELVYVDKNTSLEKITTTKLFTYGKNI